MSNDREFLALAAKASGIKIEEWVEVGSDDFGRSKGFRLKEDSNCFWNPLLDDGDALRLAVKLSMDINPYPTTNEVAAIQWGHTTVTQKVFERVGSDPYAATRRAIVRAAAEIGKSMP